MARAVREALTDTPLHASSRASVDHGAGAWARGSAHQVSKAARHPAASTPVRRSICASRWPRPLGEVPTVNPPPHHRYTRSCQGGVGARQVRTSTVALMAAGGAVKPLLGGLPWPVRTRIGTVRS